VRTAAALLSPVRSIARAVAVAAVLVGLFAMHGWGAAPAACHQSGTSRPTALAALALPTARDAGPARPSAPTADGCLEECGTLCVATAPRRGLPVPAPLPAALAASLTPPGWAACRQSAAAGRDRRRQPPPLYQLCVCRT
jgi:hypothetical protein